MSAPIDLCYRPTPNSWKISIVLEEMQLTCKVQLSNIGARGQFDPEFKIALNNRSQPLQIQWAQGKLVYILNQGRTGCIWRTKPVNFVARQGVTT